MSPKVELVVRRLKNYKPEKIILFGSHARGSSDAYSDIDLVVIKKTKKPFLDRIKEVIKIIKPNFSIDILVYTPEEFSEMLLNGNPFIESVVREGKVLYEKK